jgi:hypothetical protein
MRIQSDGNVGIGTTGPVDKLEINTGAANTGVTIGGNNSGITIKGNDGNAGRINSQSWGLSLQTAGADRVYITNGGFVGIGGYTSGTGALAISGNVGIGTTSPGTALDVVGAITSSSYINLASNASVRFGGMEALQRTSGNLKIGPHSTYTQLDFYTGGSSKVTIDNLGNVGIGTTGPLAKLTIDEAAGSAYGLQIIDSSTGVLQNSGFTLSIASKDVYLNQRENAHMRFWANGTERLTIEPISGNVGIGTTNPGAKLHVAGTIKVDNSFYFGGAGTHSFKQDSAGSNYQFTYWSGAADVPIMFLRDGGNVGIGTTSPGSLLDIYKFTGTLQGGPTLRLMRDSASGGFGSAIYSGWDGTYDMLVFGMKNAGDPAAAGNEKMVIQRSGNVGIGTTNPGSFKLNVRGDVNFGTGSGDIKLRAEPATGGNFNIGQTSETGNIRFVSNTDSPLVTIQNGGNVGIGTTGPTKRLEVKSSGVNDGILFTPSTGTGYATLFETTGSHTSLELYGNGANSVALSTFPGATNFINNGGGFAIGATSAGTAKLYINGNVGIGTTGPGAKLEVYSTTLPKILFNTGTRTGYIQQNIGGNELVLSGNDTQTLNVGGGTYAYSNSGVSTTRAFGVLTGGGYDTRFLVQESGNVGIGTTSPTRKLFVNGDAGGTGAWNNDSYSGYKENFKDISVLDKLMNLNIQEWQYKEEHLASDTSRHLSPFAEDFRAQFGLGQSNMTIQSLDVAGVALKGVQELNLKTSSQIIGLTNNQNKIVEQLTGQLADQNLTVDNKLQLIGASLDALTTDQIETLKEQITAQTKDISDLKDQIKLLQDETKAVIDFQIAFNLGKVIIKDNLGNINLLEGKITASDIEALHTIKATDIEATNSIKGQNLELGAQVSGTGMIEAGKIEVVVNSPYASGTAKISLTPKGSTQGKNIFVDDITEGVSFKVKIDAPAVEKEINFYWFIIK